MTLADKLAARAAVLAYLIHRDAQAKAAIVDGMDGDAWEAAARAWGVARADLIAAKTGRGWERHVADAKRLGFH